MKKDTSLYVPQRPKLKETLTIRDKIPWTEKQKAFFQIATDKNTSIMLIKGVAGTAKTFCSVNASLHLLNDKKMGEIIYIRNPVESSGYGLGFLKGELEDKFAPYNQPLMDKLQELLEKKDITLLMKEERIRSIPVGFLRGLSFNASCVIADESQNFCIDDLLLIMSRMGHFSKLFLTGDIQQSDIRKQGFTRVFDAFNNEEAKKNGIQTFTFDKSDIVRSEALSFIIDTFEKIKAGI